MSDYTPGKREFEADFVGTVGPGLSITKRPDAISFDYLTAFCQGPTAVGDFSAGIIDFVWRARTDGWNVWIARGSLTNSWEEESLLFSIDSSEEPIQEIDIAFEQAARPVICAARNTGDGGVSEVWLYWYNPSDSDFVFGMFDTGRNPRILLDYPPDTTISDVLMFYMKDGTGLVFRQQRDLYANVLATPVIDTTNLSLEEVAYLEGWRIAAFFSEYKPTKGQYLLRHIESKLYPVPVKDDKLDASCDLTDGSLVITLIIMDAYDIDQIQGVTELESGELVVPIIDHILYDIDELQGVCVLESGSLDLAIILHTLYDIDELQGVSVLSSGTLTIVVVTHTLHDVDKLQGVTTLQSGTLA